jgi:poly-gamma-glutamate synthesis protein (capsule biosynthesis protein)
MSSKNKHLAWGLVGALALLACIASPRAADGQSPYADARGTISIAVTGDAIINRRVSLYREPEFLAVVELLRGATLAYTNLETPLHNYEDDAFPSHDTGTYQRGRPEVAGELGWMGFDIVSTANNHTMDFGVSGMRSTLRALEAAGIAHSGAGENLALARAPGYVETEGGRVGLVSVSSTFPEHYRAGHQRSDLRGRPGLSPLRYTTTHLVPRSHLENLRTLRDMLREDGGGVSPRWTPTDRESSVGASPAGRAEAAGNPLTFQGTRFAEGSTVRIETRAHPGDLAEITASVREAKRQANWVIVSSHTHEGDGNRWLAPGFLEEFARAAIDAGADVVVGHGPKNLRGIEIYKGRPIFYSMGMILSQSETAEFQAFDNYEGYADVLNPFSATPGEFYDARNERAGGGRNTEWERWTSGFAVIDFREGVLEEIRIYPIDLGFGLHRAVQGRPALATGELAAELLEGLRVVSARYGTIVEIEDGIGIIRPVATAGSDGR